MSDERAFSILKSRQRWNPKDLSNEAQQEVRSRGQRVTNFVKQHQAELRDPMTRDLAGWNESFARNTGWPFCFKCKSIVQGYGVYPETRDRMIVIVYADCHGTRQDIEIEKPFKDVDKADPEWLRRRMRMLVCFAS